MNRPLILTDPIGLSPGDFYSKNGEYLASDGKDDQKIYVVLDKKEAKMVKTTGKTDGLKSGILLPSLKVRDAINNAIQKSKDPSGDDTKGGHHEESGIWGLDNNKQEQVKEGEPGPYADLKKSSHAEVTLPSADGLETVEGTYHIHPDGTLLVGGVQSSAGSTSIGMGGQYLSFEQTPSENIDVPFATSNEIKYDVVIGVRSKKAYISVDDKEFVSIPLDTFLNAGRN